MDVVDENEALQQFFEGQDVHRVLEEAMVDTRMLEEFIDSDCELFGNPQNKLPDSPPDSGSELCSPPQFTAACCSTITTAAPQPPPFPSFGIANKFPGSYLETSSKMNMNGQICGTHQDGSLKTGNTGTPWNNPVSSYNLGLSGLPPRTTLRPGLSWTSKKRKHSEMLEDPLEYLTRCGSIGQMPIKDVSLDIQEYDSDGQNVGCAEKCCQSLAWQPYQRASWSKLFNHNYEKLPEVGYHIVTDKGFNFSAADDAFICQKKNHFQITVYIRVVGNPKFVQTHFGLKPVELYHLKAFGIKVDTPNHIIVIEQSQSDRSKKTFSPLNLLTGEKLQNHVVILISSNQIFTYQTNCIWLSLPGDQVTKIMMARLHFSETTANNMRKKGKPNPDQRYFMLVVGLYAISQDQSYLVAAHASERIIVRASNPGQFENDSGTLWQRGHLPEDVFCHGQVGINTDTPDEALVVCGNMKVMGAVMHPSDSRAKQNIQEVDTDEQLRRIAQMRLVEYDYKPEFASVMGINHIHQTGVIAQELQELLPQAVKAVGDVMCENGEKVNDFLMVDKPEDSTVRNFSKLEANNGILKELVAEGALGLFSSPHTRTISEDLGMILMPKMVTDAELGEIIMYRSGSLALFGNLKPEAEIRVLHVKKATHSLEVLQDQIFMENVGAVKQLCKLTNNLEVRIEELEAWNKKQTILKRMNSLKSTTTSEKTSGRKNSQANTCLPSVKSISVRPSKVCFPVKNQSWSSQRIFRITVIALFALMALCIPTSPITIAPSTMLAGTTYNRVSSDLKPVDTIPEVDFCGILPCLRTYCCPINQKVTKILNYLDVKEKRSESKEPLEKKWIEKPDLGNDWIDTRISSMQIYETQQKIDHRYCQKTLQCRSGNYSYVVPLNKFTPLKVKISLEINTTEPLIIFQCNVIFGNSCSFPPRLFKKKESFPETTQGFQHLWVLPVASLHESAYHFRVAAPDLADCSTDPHYSGIFFTDYYFYFYRNCF